MPTSATFNVSPGEIAAWAKRSMGNALSAAAPAMVLEVLERKLRRVSASEAEIILFMFGFVQTPGLRAAIQTVERECSERGDFNRACPAGNGCLAKDTKWIKEFSQTGTETNLVNSSLGSA